MKKIIARSLALTGCLIALMDIASQDNSFLTTDASMESTLLIEEFPGEIIGVTVVPHYISYEIPRYTDYTKGSHIRIFIRNSDTENSINPSLLINGKNALELIEMGLVSYCDVPETRGYNNLSSDIPAGALDYYLLNVIDSSLYADGLDLLITDTITGQTIEKKIPVESPDVFVSRIVFTSSNGSVFPDGFYVYFNNDGEEDVTINSFTFYSAGSSWQSHWWLDSLTIDVMDWVGEEKIIQAHDLNAAFIKAGSIPFGEAILQVNITRSSGIKTLFYVVKPMVIDFDLGMGWGDRYFESEPFLKTIKSLHINTVNGKAKELFRNDEWSELYPMKRFHDLTKYANTRDTIELMRIHGDERLGEPQVDNKPAQGIYDLYSQFRHSAFPTTVSLTHEPGFNTYAGVVDLNHFDAYRVAAPHSDRWGEYYKYEDKNVRWAAPLETIGYYMRTLNRISYPNRVAAWVQAMSNDWSSFSRVDYPNHLEMRIQAYEAVANGATSLYWFTMGGEHIKNHRFSLFEIQHINREITLVGDLLAKTVPWWWENRFMDIDLNVLAGPDFAALFAIDLTYQISPENQFVSAGARHDTMLFALPGFLHGCNTAVKVAHYGITRVGVEISDGNAIIADTFETTAMYILYDSLKCNYGDLLLNRHNSILEKEASYNFDPINNDDDWQMLVRHIDFIDEVIPYPYLSIVISPADAAVVIGGGRHLPEEMVSLNIYPKTGYVFLNWTDESGDTIILEDGKFEMPDGDVILTANFESVIGMNKLTFSPEIQVYPNPSNGLFFIEHEFIKDSNFTVELLNNFGRTIFASEFEQGTGKRITMDLQHLEKGIYFMKIIERNIERTFKLVII